MNSTEVPSFPARDDVRSLLSDEPSMYDRSLRSAVVAFGTAVALGIGLDLLWMSKAPPQALGSSWAFVGVALVVGAGCAVGVRHTTRRVVSAWRGLFWSTLIGLVMFGWLLVFPGTDFGLFGLVIVLGFAAAIIALVVVLAMGFGSARRDSLLGLAALVAALVGCAVIGVDFGRNLRLALVRDRYETAVTEGQVEQSGGFTSGPVAAWVWIGGITNAAGVMAFDTSGTLDADEVAARLVADIGNPECVDVDAHWFWCRSS